MRKVDVSQMTAALQGNVPGGVGSAALGGDCTRDSSEYSAHSLPPVVHNVDISQRGRKAKGSSKDVRRKRTTVSQPLLGLVAPARTPGRVRFTAETRRRGGPYEVMGKRWTRTSAHPKSSGDTQ
jgi:hypothetical protein